MSDDPLIEDFATDDDLPPVLEARLEAGGGRLDKVLSDLFPTLSRARVQALLAEGVITRDGQPLTSASAKALPG
ncbi:MAG: RluA family pseudouridine synthase, partial [Alphaproteobacteria bacterium]|nr:RluA family pseudouridine synthase [Alphaproteobacteria bacterium]